MAIRNVYVAGANGIGYTKEVDSSADYASLSNDTYFKDMSRGVGGLISYKDSTGAVIDIFESVSGSNTGDILYVATTGSDDDATRSGHLGSIDNPFLTLDAAKNAALSGDLIYVFAGGYTASSNVAKDGIKYYFEPNARVTMTASTSMFDITGFSTSFDVFGHGEFYKTTGAGYILLGASGMSGYQMTFEAKKVNSTISHCFCCPSEMNLHFKVSYAASSAGSCLAHQGGAVKIDAHTWRSTADEVVTNFSGVINNSTLTVNADLFESTTNAAIYASYATNCNLNLNINRLLGSSYGLNMSGAYDATSVVLNCSFTTGIRSMCTIRFNGHCGSLETVWNGIGQFKFSGGSCQYITCGAGYIETTLGGSLATSASLNVTSGTVRISEVIGNLQYPSISITGGEAHIMKMSGAVSGYLTSLGSTREVNGGTLYLYDVDLYSVVSGPNAFVPAIKLTSGNLYLRGRIRMQNSAGNPAEASNPTTLTQTSKSNAILWTGGNLVLDGCTIITQHQDDLPILSRTAGQELRITSKGCTTNRPELSGLLAAKKEKVLLTVANVSYATVNTTITSSGTYSNFSATTAGKTTTQVATELAGLINAGFVPVVATDNGNGSFYLEASVAGDPFTYTLYNLPYNGDISLQGALIRDNSYEMTNPMSGPIISSTYSI